jgi:uncharacterized repeat protein (TIGR01451 family)
MNKENKINKVFLAVLLVSSLVMYNYPVLLVQAEGEEPPVPVCGNGTLEDGEECDDGNSADGDGCSVACTIEQEPEPEPQPVCGNGVLEDGEGCDDSNTTDGDGCSATCTVEPEPEPEPTLPVCGNGTLEDGEECDDSNLEDGDGCSAVCLIEETAEETTTTDSTNTDTVINTGDAEGDAEVENEVNTNTTDVEDCCSCEEQCPCWEQPECDCTCDCETEVSNTNDAEVGNDVDMEGSTGDNTASSNGGDSVILTGNANLVVALTNTVNTNIINSDFSNFIFNLFQFFDGNIELSDLLNNSISNNNSLSTIDCLDVDNDNTGTINNDVVIEGSTGDNTAQSQNGDATINTGNVNVAANIFNLLNTNVIGSNWTNLIINVFDDWIGDLVLPGQNTVGEYLDQSTACIGECGLSVSNTNQGEINNDIGINADTGDNTASGEDATIDTGNANVQTNVVNMVNTNSIGGKSLLLAINVFGEWKGNIFSLPVGLGVASTLSGIQIYNLDSDNFNNPVGNTSLNVINDNTGFINNSVMVNVSTGGNSATAENGQASITTGNANVFANLINILNSNLIGSDWLLGVVNIFGKWQGNLAFGRPDLWIGESAITNSAPAKVGEKITYTLTYRNNGDSDATGVTISDNFNPNIISVNSAGGGTVHNNPGEITWDIGTVPAGSSGSVSYSVTVDPEIPRGTSFAVNQAEIDSYEDDWNDQDNNDSISVELLKMVAGGVGAAFTPFTSTPKFKITKTSDVDVVQAPGFVNYTIVLENESSGFAYDIIVKDVLKNEKSEEVNTYSWNLGKVFPHEQITIEYTVAIGGGIPEGKYTNFAKATGRDSAGKQIISPEVSTIITVENAQEQLVEEELSFDDMVKKLQEIQNQIEIISQEIGRVSPKSPIEEILGSIPSMLIAPEVLASEQEGEIPEPFVMASEIGQNKLAQKDLISFLAANLGMVWNGSMSLYLLVIFVIVLLGILTVIAYREKILSKKGKK